MNNVERRSRRRIAAAALFLSVFTLGGAAADDPCPAATARVKKRVCVSDIPNAAVFDSIVVGSKLRFTRYLAPAKPKARLPLVFLDMNTYEFHQEMMSRGFPSLFPALDVREYAQIALNPARREFYAGNVVRHTDTGTYGFTVEEVDSGPIGPADVDKVWLMLKDRVTVAPLAFEPSPEQRSRMTSRSTPWRPLAMTVRGAETAPAYVVYVRGAALGRLRLVRNVKGVELPDDLGPEDIAVFDAAPFDLPAPVAGAITSVPHAELSHLNVRSAARGTPSCRIADAMSRLQSWDGKLVRLECGPATFGIQSASADEVAADIRRRRPVPVDIAPPDLSGRLTDLLNIASTSAAERATARRQYGSKSANLAVLNQRIPAAWTVKGFAIPFTAYDSFVRQGSPSLATRIENLYSDPRFLADPAYRKTQLKELRKTFETTPIDQNTLNTVSAAVESAFGLKTMVRFRSSSNAEDSLLFSGAGLYDSVSVCLADDRDNDDKGPSRCDPDTKNERGVAEGLRKVWASLWNDRAVAERLWYGIDAKRVAMGVLVDPRAKNERANIVAFTGSPNGRPGDPQAYIIEAQKGELAVVSSEPGVWPEQVRLTPLTSKLERLTGSSEAATVLADGVLRELGSRLWTIEKLFPMDDRAPEGTDIVLDTEWKVLSDGRLSVKQIRPFLRKSGR